MGITQCVLKHTIKRYNIMFKEQIKAFIEEKNWEDTEISDDEPLFSGGIIDSMDLLELVVIVETKFETKISPGQLTLENFDSINKIVKFSETLAR